MTSEEHFKLAQLIAKLRARLAEAEALLREVRYSVHASVRTRIDAFLEKPK
jgi:hypothetical protein